MNSEGAEQFHLLAERGNFTDRPNRVIRGPGTSIANQYDEGVIEFDMSSDLHLFGLFGSGCNGIPNCQPVPSSKWTVRMSSSMRLKSSTSYFLSTLSQSAISFALTPTFTISPGCRMASPGAETAGASLFPKKMATGTDPAPALV